MRRRKSIQEMTADEAIQLVLEEQEKHQRRNARRRERRRQLKNAPREETALRYRAQEQPCPIGIYLQAERFMLQWYDEFELRGDTLALLLMLAHNILHLLHPEASCAGTRLAECPSFNQHDLCSAALEITINYRLDPRFGISSSQLRETMIELARGDLEWLHFNALLGDISLDL